VLSSEPAADHNFNILRLNGLTIFPGNRSTPALRLQFERQECKPTAAGLNSINQRKGVAMKRSFFMMAMAVVLLLAYLPACQSPDVPGQTGNDLDIRTQDPNLDDLYGGFNLSDEAPGFDDPVLLSEFDETKLVEYDDPIEQEADVAYAIRCPLPQHYLMITWGNLDRDSTINYSTDWSGSLTVDRGAILL
jgi:hypothetical protein